MCEQTTFIYNGRCYTSCPDRTFMLPEKPNVEMKSKNASEVTTPPPPLPRKRAVIPTIPQKQCSSCHESCLRCRGSLNSDCTECATESIYREVALNETYCDPGEHEAGSPQVIKLFDNDHNFNSSQRFSHKSIFKHFFEHISIYMILIYVLAVTIVLSTICLICKICCKNSASSNDKKNYAYNRIAYDGTNDHIILEQEMIHTSDSSEETETIK